MEIIDKTGQPRSDKDLQEAIDVCKEIAIKHTLALPILTIHIMDIINLLEELKTYRAKRVTVALVKEARQEVAAEIFQEIEAELVAFEDFSQKTQHQAAIMKTNWWQDLKSRLSDKYSRL